MGAQVAEGKNAHPSSLRPPRVEIIWLTPDRRNFSPPSNDIAAQDAPLSYQAREGPREPGDGAEPAHGYDDQVEQISPLLQRITLRGHDKRA